jgi:hypothetical protein
LSRHHRRGNCCAASTSQMGSRVDSALVQQGLSDVLQHCAVTCPGLLVRQEWSLALMLCMDRVSNKKTRNFRRSAFPKRVLPIPGTTVSALRRHAVANWYCRSSCWPASSIARRLEEDTKALRGRWLRRHPISIAAEPLRGCPSHGFFGTRAASCERINNPHGSSGN